MNAAAVGLDSDLVLGKCHVNLVSADRVVGFPSGDAVVAQQPTYEALGLRPCAVGCGLQQSSRGGGAVATLVAQVCTPELRQFDMTLQCRVHQPGTTTRLAAASTTVSGNAVTRFPCPRIRCNQERLRRSESHQIA